MAPRLAILALTLVLAPASVVLEPAGVLAADSTATVSVSPEHAALVAEARLLMEENRASMFRPGPPLAKNRAALIDVADRLEQSGLDSLATVCLGMAGWSSFRLGEIEQAIRICERAVGVAERAGVRSAAYVTSNMLATCYAASGRPELGVRLWLDLVPKNRAIGELNAAARNWGNVLQGYALLGRVAEALEAGDSAQVAMAGANVPDGMISVAMGRGSLLLQAGRPLEVGAWADTALAHARRLGLRPAEGRALSMRASARERLGRRAEALEDLLAARRILEATGDRYYAFNAYAARASMLLADGDLAACRRELDAAQPIARSLGNPMYESVVLTLQGSALMAELRYAEAEPILRSAVRLFESSLDNGRRQANLPGVTQIRGSHSFAALAFCLAAQGRIEEAFRAAERGRTLELRDRLTAAGAAADADPAGLQRTLGPARAAVVLWADARWNPDVIFIVTAEAIEAVIQPRDTVQADARAALDLMAAGAPDARCAPLLERIGASVLGPVIERLPAGLERLYLVPPPGLAGFPMETLPAGPGAETLGERYAISYLASASVLPLLLERPAPAGGMLVFADPVPAPEATPAIALASATHRNVRETRLPAARREAARVAIPGAKRFLGAEATREHLAKETGAAVVHFATHALSNPLKPDDSSIFLAGEDGVLTASQVEGLELRADLVTLSGCQTGGGLTYVGEGTFGLPRSFLISGARSVVMSLWDVEDRATAEFMTEFYRAMRRGLPRDASLREARTRLAKRGYPLRDRAAFVLTGVGHEPVAALAAYPPGPGLPSWLPLAGLLLVAGVALAAGAARFARGRSGS